MAEFDESKIITALHTEKAENGKKYWFSNHILNLKTIVEKGDTNGNLYELTEIDEITSFCFEASNGSEWEFIYPYEEPPKKIMTNRQLAEWCAKGNGELTTSASMHVYPKGEEDEEVKEAIVIRPFGESKWIEPTVDIYERDCKGE